VGAELAGDVAVVIVLAPPGVVTDRIANQPQRRANLLHVLAGLVDRLRGLVAGFTAELLHGIVDLRLQHPPDPRADRLVVEEAIGGRVGRLAVGVTQLLDPNPGGSGGRRSGGGQDRRLVSSSGHT
jgi:hypothetical protein